MKSTMIHAGSLSILAIALTACTIEPAHHHVYTQAPSTTVSTLPVGTKTVNHQGTRYYTHNNVYYQAQGSGYQVVENPYR